MDVGRRRESEMPHFKYLFRILIVKRISLWYFSVRSKIFIFRFSSDQIIAGQCITTDAAEMDVISVFGIIKWLAVRHQNLCGFPSSHRQVQVSFVRLCFRCSMLEPKLIYGPRWWGWNTKDLVKISHSLMRVESRRGWMTWLLVANMVASSHPKRWHTNASLMTLALQHPFIFITRCSVHDRPSAKQRKPNNKLKCEREQIKQNETAQNIRNILVGGCTEHDGCWLIKMFQWCAFAARSSAIFCFVFNWNVNGCARYSVEMHRGRSDA